MNRLKSNSEPEIQVPTNQQQLQYKLALEQHKFYVTELLWKPATIFVPAAIVIYSFALKETGIISILGCLASMILYAFWFLHSIKVYNLIEYNRKVIIDCEIEGIGTFYKDRKEYRKEAEDNMKNGVNNYQKFFFKSKLTGKTIDLIMRVSIVFFSLNALTILIKFIGMLSSVVGK